MNTNEDKLIQNLKDHAMDHEPTLEPHPFFKDKFQVSYFYVDDHADLLSTVRALIFLCHRVLDPEFFENEPFDNTNRYIRQALILANRLMPMGEEALMDHLNCYFREEGLRQRLGKKE